MYTPQFNRITDRAALLKAMQDNSFAVLFGPQSSEAPLCATHLPLVVKDEGTHGEIYGHFARSNEHWQQLQGRETLVVFNGPHSYVSPTLYLDPLSVPTWNYVAVHAYGVLEVVDDEAAKNQLLCELMQLHEPEWITRWQLMPEDFRHSMLAEIVGFRIRIERIEGKFKLSQNRSVDERERIQDAFATGSSMQLLLAAWVARLAR